MGVCLRGLFGGLLSVNRSDCKDAAEGEGISGLR